MTLLFITQKLHTQDAFTVLWVKGFIEKGYKVEVICLESHGENFPFPVHSLGKDQGKSKIAQILRFWKLISSLSYDRVFIHMTPVWGVLGAWYWIPTRKPVYLWYTHYKMQLGVFLLGLYGKRFFCATSQSLPQYDRSPKKVVVGHGIDLKYWTEQANKAESPFHLLMVHRLSRSKRVELTLRALTLLPPTFTLDIYGINAEPRYVREIKLLIEKLSLNHRVSFHGTVPMQNLAEIYRNYRLILNMASETIDKTMLEAMTQGCYPVTTKRNAEAIGLTAAPQNDTPESIAVFVRQYSQKAPISGGEMYHIVESRHSLDGLISKMDAYIQKGI